tara:strand:- start:2550 stop:5414 length:2865 start_codon:yes stop_codon:yes gene_type:complete
MAKMGGARAFFTVYARMQSERVLDDTNALGAVITAVFTDAVEGVMLTFDEFFDTFSAWKDELLDLVGPVEEASIHFQKFFINNEEAMDVQMATFREYEQSIIAVGAAFNQSAETSIEAAAKMAQLGQTVGGKPAQYAATQGAMLLGAVGGMTTEDAMNRLMQLQQQSNFMYGQMSRNTVNLLNEEEQRAVVLSNTIMLVDKLNEVENTSGATIQGMTKAMNQFSSAALLANMSMDEQIALSAVLIEQGEDASKAGRSLKQMLARLASNRSDNNTVLAEHNVLVRDANGNMYGMIEIMDQLKRNTDATGRSWDQLNTTEKTNIAIAVAGAHHYVRFIKLMQGYDRALQIQESSLTSAGSATTEFANFTERASYQIEIVKHRIDELHIAMARELIPAELEATKVTYGFTKARAQMMKTFKLPIGWLGAAEVGYRQAAGFLKAILLIRVMGAAMSVYAAQSAQVTANQALRNQYSLTEARAKGVTANTMQLIGELGNRGLMTASNAAKLEVTRNTVLAARANYEIQHLRIQQMSGQTLSASSKIESGMNRRRVLSTQTEYAMLRSMSLVYNQKIGLTQKEHIAMRAKIPTLLAEVRAQQLLLLGKANLTQAEIITSKAIRDGALAKILTIEQQIQRETVLLNLVRVRSFVNTATLKEFLVTASAADIAKVKEIGRDMVLVQGKVGLNLETMKLITLKEVEILQAQGKLVITEADIAQQGILTSLMGKRTKATMLLIQATGALMMASMGASMLVYLFADSEHRAEAAAIAMAFAMVPLILSTIAFTAGLEGMTWALAGATMGLSVLLAVAAAWAAKKWDFMGDGSIMGEDFDELIAEAEGAGKVAEAALAAIDLEIAALEAEMGFVTGEFSSDIDDMEAKMVAFDDKRMEIFFGGRKSAMDAAMFKEIKNNGVENLYFAPEVHVTNVFNGLTMDEAIAEIGGKIETALKQSGTYQLIA